MNLLEKNELPQDFVYPNEFLKIVEQGLIDFDPWVIMSGEYLKTRYDGLRKRYPKRLLVPFARRIDNDDIACWDINIPNKVVTIHDFASENWEQRKEYETFWVWLRQAVDDMIENDN